MYINYKMQMLGESITLANGEDDGREIVSVEDYDFKHEITQKDLIDFYAPNKMTREFELGFTNAFQKILADNLIDLYELETNKDFNKFMQDKYADEAKEAWLKDKLEQEEADNA